MAEERLRSKRHQLDLADKKFELDQVFDSVINRLPDLCMPPSYRLAGEDDFFNCTKSIKLVPFKKQAAFERNISPELGFSRLASFQKARGLHSHAPDKSNNQKVQVKSKTDPEAGNIHETQQATTSKSSATANYYQGKGKLTKEQIERKRKNELRDAIKKRYSKLSTKRSIHDQATNNRLGYDRLFINTPPANYPYLNPIPECMMTENNIDNLREIIVSAIDIEWKMLTPVRPHSEYEEKYFDRLIQLHRYRYKTRLDIGYFEARQKVPFKHIRHTYMVQYDNHKNPQTLLPPNADGSKALGRKLSSWLDIEGGQVSKSSGSQFGVEAKLNVPKLTLTSDETYNSRPIVDSGGDLNRRDCSLFDYGNYSRLSKENSIISKPLLRSISESRLTSGIDNLNSINNGSSNAANDVDGYGGVFEDRVEEILSKLININMSDG